MDCCKTKDERGCCSDMNKSSLFGNADKKSLEKIKEMKGGERKMNSRITLWIVIGVLFVTALFLTFKAGTVGSVETVRAAASSASSGGMVGGC